MARNYSSTAGVKTLAADITTSSATQLTLTEATDDLPSPPFMLVLNPDTAKEEVVLVQADQSEVSEPTYKIVRGQDGTTPTTHTSGDTVKHMIVGSDLQIPHDHIDSSENVHGISDTSFLTYANNTQTLTNKTLTSPKINENVALTATSTELNVLDGITASTTELNYVDGVTSAIQSQIDLLLPKGMIAPYAGATAPTGWLLCNGSAVSRSTYSALFSAIGTTYGAGDNSTTFNLPDLLGRAPIGAGTGTGLTARTLGAEVGSESTTLTSAHIPEHSHTINHDHGAFNTTGGEGAHTHDINAAWTSANDHDHAGRPSGWEEWASGAPDRSGQFEILSDAARSAGAHNHSVDVPNFTGNSGNYGTASPTAVTAVQPSTVVNFIIKF